MLIKSTKRKNNNPIEKYSSQRSKKRCRSRKWYPAGINPYQIIKRPGNVDRNKI